MSGTIEGSVETSLPKQVEHQLQQGNLVIVIGPPASGKSWLVNEVMPSGSVIDRSSDIRSQDMERARLFALVSDWSCVDSSDEDGDLFKAGLTTHEKWLVRTQASVALDEAQLFRHRDILELFRLAISCHTGVLVAVQREECITEVLAQTFRDAGKLATVYELECFDDARGQPRWRCQTDERAVR